MNLHLDLTLTDEQTEVLRNAAAQSGLPIEVLVQRTVERFLTEQTLAAAPFADLLAFAHGLNFDTVDVSTIQITFDERNFVFPKPTELMAMSETDRSLLLQLSALLAEEAYRNDPDLNFEVYDDILDYDDYITDTNAKHS